MTKSTCALCFRNIEKVNDEVVSGAPCKHCLHARCVQTRLSLERQSDANNAVRETCPVCHPPGLLDTHLLIIAKLDSIDAASRKVFTLVDEVKRLNDKVEKLFTDNAAIKSEVAVVMQSISSVRRDLDNLAKDTVSSVARLQAVEDQLASRPSSSGFSRTDQNTLLHLACRDMANEIVISGIPEMPDSSKNTEENLNELMVRLGLALETNLLPGDVVKVERMGKKTGQKKVSMIPGIGRSFTRPILLELNSKSKCAEIIAAKKLKRDLCASQIATWYPRNKVYINHRHPTQLHQLRNTVLKRFPNLDPKAVWISDEAVYLRKSRTSKPLRLVPSTDLTKVTM